MQVEKKHKTAKDNWLMALIFCYIGFFGVIQVFINLENGNILMHGLTFIIFSAIASYGVICLIMDFREGGIHAIINRIKKFRYGGDKS